MHGTDRASVGFGLVLAGVAAAGVLLGLSAAGWVHSGEVAPAAGLTVAVALPVGWSYLAIGLYAWRRRPDSLFGLLLIAVCFAWFAAGAAASDVPALRTAGLALSGLYYAVLVHLLLAFPDGRIHTRVEKVVVVVAYGTATAGQLLLVTVSDTPGPTNLLLIRADAALAAGLADAIGFLGAAVTLMVAATLAARWHAATARDRRAQTPVLGAGAALTLLLAVSLLLPVVFPSSPAEGAITLSMAVVVGVVPYAFLVGLARARFFAASTVTDLLTRLTSIPGGRELGGVRSALAGALNDPGLVIAYWLPDRGVYVDADGTQVSIPPPGRAVTLVELEGQRVAALVHDPTWLADPELVRAAGAAAALGLDNERLTAELRARVAEVEDSRRRVVEAAESERRRLERDLHDGAQQRLVGLRVTLALAEAAAGSDPHATHRMLGSARVELDAALSELRDLARGLHPAILSTRGLPAALTSLTARSPVPVELAVDLTGLQEPRTSQRLAPAVESAVYFMVAEALTNVARHAAATRVRVDVTRQDGCLRVDVLDDGTGGADPAGGGLRGLADRVAALDGSLTVRSAPGSGTLLRAEIPLGPAGTDGAHRQARSA